MKGNLTEHAACCGHSRWWHGSLLADRKPFALPGTFKRYAPDMPVNVHHVKLVLNVDPEQRELAGICQTTVEVITDELTELFFEAQEMSIAGVSLAASGADLPFERSEHGFKVKLPHALKRGDKVEIVVEYSLANPRAGIYFTGPSGLYPDKPHQVWTQGQDEDARFWYPVAGADYPNHKMTSEVIVTVPGQYTALSNGKLVRESLDEAGGIRTFHWLQDRPHVSYLVTLAVGVFAKLEESYKDLPVQLYCDPALLERARAYFKGTADLIALFSRLYGVEYPWSGKYAQVMVQDFIFGGMENTTMTTMTDRILADARARDEYRRFEIRLNAHELNHHWFGNLITCRDWSHAWLNEGGATYGEVEAIEHLFGVKERDYYVKWLADTYFAEDKRYRRPIVTNLYQEPIDLFDRHLYQKGALVRHMLRYLLGDQGYYRCLRTFLTDFAYQPVETHDLIKSIEKATGRNLREFFDQWVYGVGFPEYKVSYVWDEKNQVATAKVSQTQKTDDGTAVFSMPIRMSFSSADGRTRDYQVLVNEKEQSFSFAVDFKPAMFRFDPDNWVLKKLDLTGVPKAMLVHQLGNDPAVMGRVYAAHALGALGGRDAVEALARAVGNDFHWGVAAEAASALATIGTPAAREALKAAVSVSDPRVRRSVVAALGSFKDESVADLLAGILSGGQEQSYFVLADAAVALGKTRSEKAFPALQAALAIPSWNEVVRVGVLNGLAELGDARGVDLAAEYAGAGKPWHARPAAIAALGKLAGKAPRAVDVLHSLAESEEADQFTLRMAVIGALGEAKNPASLPVLSRLGQTALDGRIKRAVAETLGQVESAQGTPTAQVDELKAEIERVTGKLREITERLEKQEAGRQPAHRTARKRSTRKRASRKGR